MNGRIGVLKKDRSLLRSLTTRRHPFPFSFGEGGRRPDEVTQAWSGKTVKQYKEHKDLKKENLRDNMTNLELVLNMLAEATTTEISKEKNPKNLEENKIIAKQGGNIAGDTRKAIEAKTGKKVLSNL
jgi:hypothetical protein